MKAIFGLGNPGKQYRGNRHNIGHMLIDALAESCGVPLKRSLTLNAQIGIKGAASDRVLFVKPLTYMNNSGLCVRQTQRRYAFTPGNILIVYDDVDLAFGEIRMRPGGSSGGHRGMASIIESLGTQDINRLKVGIGREGPGDVSDRVLSDFSRDEARAIPEILERACAMCIEWIDHGADAVMRKYNRRGGKA